MKICELRKSNFKSVKSDQTCRYFGQDFWHMVRISLEITLNAEEVYQHLHMSHPHAFGQALKKMRVNFFLAECHTLKECAAPLQRSAAGEERPLSRVIFESDPLNPKENRFSETAPEIDIFPPKTAKPVHKHRRASWDFNWACIYQPRQKCRALTWFTRCNARNQMKMQISHTPWHHAWSESK